MANYISTTKIQETIDEMLMTTNRFVAILPLQSVVLSNVFSGWDWTTKETLDLTIILTGENVDGPKLTANSIAPILSLKRVKIFHHSKPTISKILSDDKGLLLPNGLLSVETEKAGVLSNLGIDHQDDLPNIQANSKLVFHKKPQFKKKFFGLQKSIEGYEVVQDVLGLVE